MNRRPSLWIFAILTVLFSLFVVNVRSTYAQEEEVVIAKQFVIRPTGQAMNAAATNEDRCEITAELRWYKKKAVRVLYHWQGCPSVNTIRWEVASVHNSATDTLSASAGAGSQEVYRETWSALSAGDTITLRTWINDVRQADVVTEYRELAPIWVKLHTRPDTAGACFQFTGHVDPWGVFTAGEHEYVLHLDREDWETPWLEGPDQPTVDWHVQFYRDEQLTQLRTEYWFKNVPNPCHTPPRCDSIALSIPNGAAIPEGGADVQVTIAGQHGSQYQIVDQDSHIVAGPSVENELTFHAMPGVTYQAQVYNDRYGWTTAGCQFEYGLILRPGCTGVALSVSTDTLIPLSGQAVDVTITAENATQYRIVDAQGNVVVSPSSSNVLSLHAMPNVNYQAQVYNETYGWTTSGCQFSYIPVADNTVCHSVALSVSGPTIPATGVEVDVTVNAENALFYRIVDADGVTLAGPSAGNVLTIHALPSVNYQAQVQDETGAWSSAPGCQFSYMTPPPQPPVCESVVLSIPNGASIPETGAEIQVTIVGQNAIQYRIVDSAGTEVAGPGPDAQFSFHAIPNMTYQAQVKSEVSSWTTVGCQFIYNSVQQPVCSGIALSVPNGAVIPVSGADVEVTVSAEHASRYRIVDSSGAVLVGPSDSAVLHLHALPDMVYQAQVADASENWTNLGCQFEYEREVVETPTCDGVALSIPNGAVIAAGGADVAVAIAAQRASQYRIVDERGAIIAGPSTDSKIHLHAMPGMGYQAQVANAQVSWTTSGCQFKYTAQVAQQPACELQASHYGDPGGRSRITAWIDDQREAVAIEKVQVNWDNHKTVTYPTKTQAGPWYTNTPFELVSRPEVHDVGFGYYKFEAWVYVAGFDTPAYCWSDGNAPDHDNVAPDPGPFAKANPEGKFNRGNTPSRLPSVGRLPFDGGNGADKIELILWAFEKEGRGMNTRITALANEGKPLARLGMESVSSFVKFDGLPAREGIVYGFQIGEHGPWSPLFCPQPDNNPTTITVYWAAGGMTWLSDGAAYGDCWWLTVAAALNGWVTVDERVATYNALQPVIDWNGHRNLVFSLAQSRETGLGPRMQDTVIGLRAREWQGPVVPEQPPADFWQTVEVYLDHE